jgi:PAS domain S-box-containing protein
MTTAPAPADEIFPACPGQTMGQLIAGFDWRSTPAGPIGEWPQALHGPVSLILCSSLPMMVLWGRDGTILYNDGFAAFAGARHPACLGQNVADGWPELAAIHARMMDAGFSGGPVELREDLLVLQRNAHAEDVWVDMDLSLLPGVQQEACGVLVVAREITGHVLSQWRRQEAENQLSFAIDATELGTWDYHLITNALNWSEKCRAAFGIFTDVPATMERFRLGLHPADSKPVFAAMDRAANPLLREVFDVEFRTIGAADGMIRWVAARGRTVFDEQKRPVRMIGTMLDITARKTAELRHTYLVELGDRLRALDSTAQIAAAAAEILGRALEVSRVGYAVIHNDDMVVECDWTDHKLPSLVGPRRFSLMGPAACAALLAGQMVVIADVGTDPMLAGSRAHFIKMGVGALLKAPLISNGELAAILYVHQGSPRAWTYDEVNLLRDIADRTWEASGRAKAAQGLRKLNETLEQEIAYRTAQRDRMWKLSSDVMMVANFDAIIESVNPAWKTVFGWSEDDLIGRNFINLTHPDDRKATRAEVRRLSQGQPTTHFESRYRRRDGSYLWLSWRAVPDAGSLHAVGRDITAEREQAGALQAAEEALRQAQKMEAVGQLTGGIAHDFNNLLQGIVGSLDLLDRRLAQNRFDEVEKFVAAARVSANRAVALTHRLLAFSRRQPLIPKPTHANPLVASMEDLLRRTMGETIEIALMLAPDLWLTLCDPNQLESAILNLAINARDAMPDGGRLVLETRNMKLDSTYAARAVETKPGDYICVSVTDTGTGMSHDVIEQAFEPFYTTKPIGQGTGLGLSMVYGFSRQSGGQTKIYSEIGIGTTVKIYLPRHFGEAEEDEAAPASAPLPQAEQGETVLVVEDETVVRGLVVAVLDELGYLAVEAADGPSGLQILQSPQRVDLLITDIGLPGLNGRQMADAARLLRPGLKVLFMTGYAESAAASNGFLEPGMAMVTKPFPIDVLTSRIRMMLERDES